MLPLRFFPSRQVASILFGILIALTSAGARETRDPLVQFLRSYVGTADPEAKATQYDASLVDLKDDGTKDVIVYLSRNGWCGTAGCTMLILSPEAESYRVVAKVPAVRLPIRVLAAKSNGWHDLGVESTTSVRELSETTLCFDGRTYMPSGLPDHRSYGEAKGTTVISAKTKAKGLFP